MRNMGSIEAAYIAERALYMWLKSDWTNGMFYVSMEIEDIGPAMHIIIDSLVVRITWEYSTLISSK